jgi:putative MFS transporter
MNTSPVNAGPRLDRLPIARFHWRILGLIGAGALLDAFDVYLAGGVLAATLAEGFSTLETNALFISSGFFGMLIGAALAGWVGDRYGRRVSYQTNLAIFGAASILAVFAPNMESLIALRFLMGIGLGAELVVAAGTLCEFIPPAWRGRWISLLGMIINSGLLLATGIGWVVIPHLGWRWMFGIAGAGALLIWVMRKKMPESPRWLEATGRTEEAERTLREIEREIQDARPGRPLAAPAAPQPVSQAPVPLSALFARGTRGRTLVAALLCVAINVSIYGFVAWLPTFFVAQGLTVVKSLGFTTLMALGGPAGALLGFLLGDRLGRRRGIIAFAVLSAVLGIVYTQMRTEFAITLVGFALVSSLYTIVTLGLYGYIPEMFTTRLRLRATGFTSVCGRAAAMATPFMVVALHGRFGVSGVLGMVVGILVLLVSALLALGVETNQESLEALDDDEGAAQRPAGAAAAALRDAAG